MATAEERAQVHWNRLSAAILIRPDRTVRWTDRGIAFIASQPFLTPEGRGIGLTIFASDINGALPVDNPYIFYNPFTGTIIGWTNDEPPVPIVDTSEPLQAVKRMAYDAVTFRARQLGWSE